jgi:hypothetical protein
MIVEIEVVIDHSDDHRLLVGIVAGVAHVVVQELAGRFDVAKAVRGGTDAR